MNFFSILFIGISLQSYYYYQFSAPLITLVSLFIMSLLLIGKLKFVINKSIYVLFFYLSIFFISFIASIYFAETLVVSKVLGFFICIFCCWISNSLLTNIDIFSLIRNYLIIHLFFFFLQFISYYFFKTPIDYLFPFTGEEQRLFGGTFELPYFNSFMRASGLFNEPGTYVTFLAPLIVIFGRSYKSFERNDFIVFILSLLSLFLSFSVFGIIFGLLILLFSPIFSFKSRLLIGGLISFIIIIPYISYRFFFNDLNLNSDSGLGFREIFISESLKFLYSDIGALLLGSGHLSLNPKANFIASYNDIGLIPYLLHFSGPILTLILCIYILFLSLSIDRFSVLGVAILFLSKLSILAPFFPFVLTLLLWPPKRCINKL